MLIFLIPLVAGEASSFYKSIPPYLEKLKGWAEELIARWNEKYPDRKIDWESILDRVKVAIENNAQRFATTGLGITSWIIEKISSGIKEILIFLSYVILIPIYTFFLLHNLNRIRDWIFLRLPEKYKEKTILVLSRIDRAMSSFFRGKLIICIIKGILTAIGLSIVGIRFAFVFGIIQTVASIIPYLPLVLALIPAELVVIFDLGAQWNLMISVAIIFIIIELIEGVLLTPLILGKEMGLHPIYIILALLIGGTLFGLFGLLIAIPIASIIKILLQELLGKNLHEVKANP
jgi:predicted PurR-regulated permease PerM